MEKNKNSGLIVLVIMLFIIVLGLSGFIGYHITVSDKEKINEIKDLKKEIKELKKEQKENKITEKENESDIDKVKRMFKEYLETSEEKPLDYKIGNIEIKDDSVKNTFNYEKTDILADVTFSVKVNDINSSWVPGNGEFDENTNWINDKYDVVLIRDGKLSVLGTSP